MYLVQLLLPLRDNEKQAFPRAEFDRVRNELTERFGGATAFLRSPACQAFRVRRKSLRGRLRCSSSSEGAWRWPNRQVKSISL